MTNSTIKNNDTLNNSQEGTPINYEKFKYSDEEPIKIHPDLLNSPESV